MNPNKNIEGLLSYSFYLILTLLSLNFYIFCYPLWSDFGLTNEHLDNFIRILFQGEFLYKTSSYSKALIIIIHTALIFLSALPKKKENLDKQKIGIFILVGLVLFFGADILLSFFMPSKQNYLLYIILSLVGYFIFFKNMIYIKRVLGFDMLKDRFNRESTEFKQTEELIKTEYSVNIPYRYTFEGKEREGWINYVNLFRALAVLGTPGSGKSYAIIEEIIKQLIQKGFSMYVYDYKYPTLTNITYNYLLKYPEGYKKKPAFYVLNFDEPEHSNRCNPISVNYLTDVTDAIESARIIMLALNRTWAKKEGDFFPESAINFVATLIWCLRILEDGKYCTFPHLIQLSSLDYDSLFAILKQANDASISNMLSPYLSAYEKGAAEQLEGQIGTVRIGLSRLTSPLLYWVTSSDDVPFDINDPENPSLLCVGNNPQRQQIYGAAISLINFRIMQRVNQQKKNPCGIIIDELPTIYPGKGTLDNLIASGRSNKVATVLGFQDATQMERDLGKESATAIINTIGNLASGSVLGTTADNLSKRMGKIKIQKKSVNVNSNDTGYSLSEENVDLLPQSEISSLTQGTLFGFVADDFGTPIKEKRFVGKVLSDKSDQTDYPLPLITSFTEDGTKADKEVLNKILNDNFNQIQTDIENLSIKYPPPMEEEEELF